MRRIAAVWLGVSLLSALSVSSASAGTPNWLPLRATAKVGCVKTNCGGYHGYWAIDLLDPARTAGDPVYSAGSGRVLGRGFFGSCLGDSGSAIRSRNARGNWVEIDHGGGVKTRYFHLNSISVSPGQSVSTSTKIGTVGNTGASTCRAPHLHFEKMQNGVKVDPGTLYACHGSKKVGYSSWNASKDRLVRSDGVACGAPKPKPKPKPKSPAPAGKGDSTGYFEPGPRGFHLSNALAPGPSNYFFARGAPGSIPVVGDWNGDGKDSTGVFYPWDMSWHLRNELSPGSSQYIFARGESGSIPVVGDWNGDGKDSTGAYYPWDQTWHLRNELSAGSSQYIFKRGQPNAIPVVGDWNGDGKDSTGLYFPWDRSWHLRNELSDGPSQYIFVRGEPNSIPLVGDWNGDGKDSTGVFFPWDNSFHLRNELNPGPSQYAFARAASDSIPVVGNWDGL